MIRALEIKKRKNPFGIKRTFALTSAINKGSM